MSADAEALIREQLPKSWSVKRRDEAVEQIACALEGAGLLLYGDGMTEVGIRGARMPIEQVSAYGLDISLDANGNAALVGFPYGAEVVA